MNILIKYTPEGNFEMVQGHLRLQAALRISESVEVMDVTNGVMRTVRLDDSGTPVIDRTIDAAAAMHMASQAMAKALVTSAAELQMRASGRSG